MLVCQSLKKYCIKLDVVASIYCYFVTELYECLVLSMHVIPGWSFKTNFVIILIVFLYVDFKIVTSNFIYDLVYYNT
jgi:hypothetical protein